MHGNAAAVNAAITAWIDRKIGPGPGARGSTPGIAPGAVPAVAAPPDPVALAANRILLAATPTLVQAYLIAVDPVPGLGEGSDPVPAYNELLRTIANLRDWNPGLLADAFSRQISGLDHF